jgi:hypothetical protein
VQQIDQVLIPIEKVEPGMFPSERAITVRGIDRELTLFVDQGLIETRGQRQYLRVTRLETDREKGVSVCLLPVSASEGTRWIRIPSDSLLEAA